MPNIHALLDECQTQCNALVEEIQAIKQSRSLHEKTTAALEAACMAIQETSSQIAPFRDAQIKRIVNGLIVGVALNTLLTVTVLFLVILKP